MTKRKAMSKGCETCVYRDRFVDKEPCAKCVEAQWETGRGPGWESDCLVVDDERRGRRHDFVDCAKWARCALGDDEEFCPDWCDGYRPVGTLLVREELRGGRR